jgi:hypothetical protein
VAKPNQWDGYCDVCHRLVRAGEGWLDGDPDAKRGYVILCPEHMPDGGLDAPTPPEASKLPSIHLDEERYER